MAKFVYGIDLGTTYSCISYVDETGRAVIIYNAEGTNTTPSVVNFSSPNQVVVGQVAKENAVIEPSTTISLVKTLMGKSDFAINYNGEDKSPEEVSAYILRKLVEDASKIIDSPVQDVVITCPAYFGTAERTATKNAGIIAGLNVLEIISEPTAAAIYYGCAKDDNTKTILVYDLGGGTFDVTVMNISQDKIEVVCSDGNHQLGGKDWDEAIMRYLAEQFRTETNYTDDFDEFSQQDLRLKAEKAKQQLSSREEVPVMVDVSGERVRINLNRQTFEEITSVLLNETISKTQSALDLAKDKGFIVEEMLLVGGSTRMPQITQALSSTFNIKTKILEPDEAVAKGAAIHAVNVYINQQSSISEWKDFIEQNQDQAAPPAPVSNIASYEEELAVDPILMSIGGKVQKVVVATTKSFALKVLVNGDEEKCCNMIIKNQPMTQGAIRVKRTFGTAEANQTNAEIIVYENDFMEEYFAVDEDYILGTATLDLPTGLPVQSPIEITFTLNTEGILEVSGKDLTSQKEVYTSMQSKGIMATDKVEELKAKLGQIVVM